ncbi:MAG: peptidyl-prolyl cis-trans isomerase [Candidatus Omnitrophica bacterium]|nr:peptidyl-prolyl cis-trans isomerase [Candidatus Omnitrophota bacterium]MBU4487557.1 peptidyl-prolyl cis-trans isomerase [Candidatus Omnitrophota bacterium]MCG2705797.1 peptidyl-prolyl cis-trans isomerase [Candidatus Omnitrophota bacterium]
MSRIKKEALITNTLCASLSILLCFIAYGCAKKTDQTPIRGQAAEKGGLVKVGEVVASVGGENITISEYEEEMAMLPPMYRSMAISNKQQFVDSLINKHLLLGEAKRRHLENNENVKKLLSKAKDEIMMQELIGIEITDKIKITDDDIGKYYEANKDKYIAPQKTRVSHILVDSEVVAQKVLFDLRKGEDFAVVCEEYSLDIPTKAKGGDTGYFAKGSLLPEFEEACDSLEVGDTSGVVKTGLGYHIVRVTDRKESQPRQLSEVRNEIENELFIEKQISLYEELMQGLKKGKEVRVNNTVFDKIGIE